MTPIIRSDNFIAAITDYGYAIFTTQNEYDHIIEVGTKFVFIGHVFDYSKYDEVVKLIDKCKIELSLTDLGKSIELT